MSQELTDEGRAALRPTAERIAKGGVKPSPSRRGEKAKPWNASVNLADYYLDGEMITLRQWKAADEFTRVYYRAHGSPWRVASWQGPINGSSDDLSDGRLAAQYQLKLIASKLTETLYSVIRDVCGLHTPVSTWARHRGIHPASGMPLLKVSLDLYAKHLGLPEEGS